MTTGKFPELNIHTNDSPTEDSSKPSTELEDKALPVSSDEKGSAGIDALSKLHQKSPKAPLPLPSKK